VSTSHGRISQAIDRAQPITEGQTVEVLASDLDALLEHYRSLIVGRAFGDVRRELSAAVAAERDEICERIRLLRIAKECVQDDIDRMHNRTISDVLTIIRSRQEPQG